MQVDSEDAGECYMDGECIEVDNLDSLGNDELNDVMEEYQQTQTADTGQCFCFVAESFFMLQ